MGSQGGDEGTDAPPPMPLWVKVSGLVGLALLVVLALVLLFGPVDHGPGWHGPGDPGADAGLGPAVSEAAESAPVGRPAATGPAAAIEPPARRDAQPPTRHGVL